MSYFESRDYTQKNIVPGKNAKDQLSSSREKRRDLVDLCLLLQYKEALVISFYLSLYLLAYNIYNETAFSL